MYFGSALHLGQYVTPNPESLSEILRKELWEMTKRHGELDYFVVGEGVYQDRQVRSVDPATAKMAAAVGADEPNRMFRFSRMFPDLAPFRPAPCALTELGQAMSEAASALDPATLDHPTLPAGFTYLGQFIDHDITFDQTEGLPSGELTIEEIRQGRSPSLDLDSLYGRGPEHETLAIYEADGIHLRVGQTTPDALNDVAAVLPNDLLRDSNKQAQIGDKRNDENLAVAQTHLAMIKFHNFVADHLPNPGQTPQAHFAATRRLVVQAFQSIVLHDFLPRLVDQRILNDVLTHGRRWFQFEPYEEPTMPIEFSVAAYRLGHSMIRPTYEWNRFFASDGPALSGDFFGAPTLPSNWVIDWTRFFDFADAPDAVSPARSNKTRRIDPVLTDPLANLPGTAGQVPPQLAVRNLLRGRLLGLPSGQAVAAKIEEQMLTPDEVASGPHSQILRENGFDRETPLWYYVLKEAEVCSEGVHLGPVGSRILAETFVGLIEGSQNSILRTPDWQFVVNGQAPKTQVSMVDLLTMGNELNPLG
jgi:hypothetical protein